MLRVLLLEDEALLLLTLASSLPDDTMMVVGAFESAKSAVAAAAETPFDVLVTDLDLGDGLGPNGIVVANVVRRANPAVGIVLLTSYADPRLIGTTLTQVPAGTEYVRKQDVRDINVLRAVIRRAAYGSSDATPDLPAVALTDLQIETMRLIAQGLSNAEIARQRVVTERAVEMSIGRIVRSLGYTNDSSLNTRALIIRAYFELTGSSSAHGKIPS
jgi:DNA-binding NarL/FixJ family response regulator